MYKPGRSYAGPSKASATTLCQKCLQKGHYSYECTVPAQSRPYNSRPSRTQQLLNPTLIPKLSSDTINPLLRKEGVADEQLARTAKERGRQKHSRDHGGISGDDSDGSRRRSQSSSSSASISTISTNRSRSRSPPKPSARASKVRRRKSNEAQRRSSHNRSKSRSDSGSSSDDANRARRSTKPARRKSRGSVSVSPAPRARAKQAPARRRSRSPSWDGNRPPARGRVNRSPLPTHSHERPSAEDKRPRMRSLSPYSKRLALTQAMNI